MAWYKKQLKEILKKQEIGKTNGKKALKTQERFDPSKLKGKNKSFSNPVAAMNRNRKKTDLP